MPSCAKAKNPCKKHDLSSLRLLASVGEPINPEAWMWYYTVIGQERCPVVDTWWQTETGGLMIAPIPGAIPTKPGSATVPFFGVEPAILSEDGKEVGENEGGWLVIKKPWPGMMRTLWNDPDRFKATYFSKFPGAYTSGDGARKDQDGYYGSWAVSMTSSTFPGHRIGTAEVESSLVSHPRSPRPPWSVCLHHSRDRASTPMYFSRPAPKLHPILKKNLRPMSAPTSAPSPPDVIQIAEGLPKTRSGKIMRRILVKIAAGDTSSSAILPTWPILL